MLYIEYDPLNFTMIIGRHFSRSTLSSLRMTFILLENHTLDTMFQLLHPGFTKETKKNKEFS